MTHYDPTQDPTAFVDVGHCRLAYWRIGQGPNVVFVHGWPVTSATFRRHVDLLSPRFTCHLFDLPGIGRTEWDDGTEVSLSAHARSMQTAVEQLEIDRYALVAHDSGAVVARLLAAEHGDRVSGLVMGNTEIPGHHPWRVQLFLKLGRLPGGRAALAATLKYGPLRRSGLALGACFEDPRYGDGEFHELFIAPLLNSRRTFAGQMLLLDGFEWDLLDDLESVHRKITCPVQMIWGSEDPYFPLAKARSMLAHFPGSAELEVIEGAKLFAHEDHAATFGAHADRFLSRCTASPGIETRAG